jgi:hypothetical protein
MKSANDTSYYDRVRFKEEDTYYMLLNRDVVSNSNRFFYTYDVYTSTNDTCYFFLCKVFVNYRLAQKRSCLAIYNAITSTVSCCA